MGLSNWQNSFHRVVVFVDVSSTSTLNSCENIAAAIQVWWQETSWRELLPDHGHKHETPMILGGGVSSRCPHKGSKTLFSLGILVPSQGM